MITNPQKTLIHTKTIHILQMIMANPHCNANDIIKTTKIPSTLVYRYIEKLLKQNIIKKDRSRNSKDKGVFRYKAKINRLQITVTKSNFKVITHKT